MRSDVAYTLLILVLVAALAYGGITLYETAKETARLDALEPSVGSRVRQLRANLLLKGIRTTVGQTVRSDEEQENLPDTATATNDSWHEVARAIDLYPHRPGQAWDKGDWADYVAMYTEAAKLGARQIGMNADGTKRFITNRAGTKTWDGGHLEFRDGLTYAQAKAAFEEARSNA
jgi:hypothetical protein